MDVEGEQGDRWGFSGTSECAMEIEGSFPFLNCPEQGAVLSIFVWLSPETNTFIRYFIIFFKYPWTVDVICRSFEVVSHTCLHFFCIFALIVMFSPDL